jgi:hypothetical protein
MILQLYLFFFLKQSLCNYIYLAKKNVEQS